MKNSTLVALAALTAKCDLVLFRQPDDEESHTGRNLAIAGGVATGAGGLAVDHGVMSRYGKRGLIGSGSIPMGSPRSINTRSVSDGITTGGTQAIGRKAAYAQAGQNIRRTVGEAGSAASAAGKMAYGTMRAGGESQVASVLKGLRKAGKVGVSKLKRFNATGRLIELAAKAEAGIINFDQAAGPYQLTGSDHYARHALGPVGVAITSRKGKKAKAFVDSLGNYAANSAGGTLGGAAVGAGIGAGVGALRMRKGLGHGAGMSAASGALIGGVVGSIGGGIRGTHGKKAREIQAKYHA